MYLPYAVRLAGSDLKTTWNSTHWWDFPRELDRLGNLKLALVDGALHIDILDLLAEVCSGFDKTNETVFDLKLDVCAFFDVFLDRTGCLDDEFLATVE